jgi:CRISPR type I-E-associated protein CasB/Cse2
MTWKERLISKLERYAREEDRAALAALRRSLDEEVASLVRAAPLVAPALPAGLEPWNERSAYLLSGLFALHPKSGKRSLAESLRIVKERRGSGSIEARFVALLSASLEDIAPHLRHAVALLRADDLGIDWSQLLEDLSFWSHPAGRVQRRWAADFWAAPEPKEDESTNHTEPNTTETA